MADNGQGQIKTSFNQFIKTHSEFDGSFRLTHLYECASDTGHGKPCTVTRFSYDGASTRVVGTKEELTAWDSAWDI